MKRRPGPLVEVYWDDIYADSGWSDDWRPRGRVAHCIEVGYLVRRDAAAVVLVRGLCDYDRDGDRHSGATVTIPMPAVTKVVVIRR